MATKENEYDLTVDELESEHGITVEDYGEAGEVCVKFMEKNCPFIPSKRIVAACTTILDNQREGERFSDTRDRVFGFKCPF